MNQQAGNRDGFTLLEVMVVIVIIGLLGGVAILSLREPFLSARFREAIERVNQFDHQIRDHARRFQRNTTLIYDLERGVLTASQRTGGWERNLTLPNGVKFEYITTASGRTDFGKVIIQFTRDGGSETYAVGLIGTNGTRQSILFSGITGQSELVDDKQRVRILFEALAETAAGSHSR